MMNSIVSIVLFCGVFLSITLSLSISATNSLRLNLNGVSRSPVFVAGGSRGVGLEVLRKLSFMGTPVHALVRSKDAYEYLRTIPGVSVTLGDAMDSEAVQSCMRGCGSAVTTLGGGVDKLPKVDYEGNSNVIEQAGILGVERIVLVTSIGCGSTKHALPADIYDKLKEVLVAKSRAERDLKMYTNLDWTIIRPGRLVSGAPSGRAILTADPTARGSLDRQDLADLIVKVLDSSDGPYTRRELSAIDPSQKTFQQHCVNL